ncbi:MAG TPA: AAA family ATPase [Acidimicrobiales bacterium]|jgi:hypothetical protein
MGDSDEPRTLGARLSAKDRTTFVGRAAEFAAIAALLVDDPPASIMLVHGPGGIGKSALLREVARRGEASGWSAVLVEGRDLPPLPDAVDEAIAPARTAERPLVLIDSYERMTALGTHLRRVVLPTLPARAVVVIAGRRPPDHGWFEGGWESVTRELELGPLSSQDSLDLLKAHGLPRTARIRELATWASGSPLALTFVARAADDPGWRPGEGGEPRDVVRTLVRRLAEAELDPQHRDVLWLACIARVTTARLIRDVLPGIDAEEATGWLHERSFSEPLGDGLTLHDLVRRALRSDLRQRDPERERDLRRRIADSLYARALAGHPLLTIDLAELIETPELRALYGWEGAMRNQIDSVREGDAEEVARHLAAIGSTAWWDVTRPFFEEAPEFVAIARGDTGALCGYSITMTPASAPAVAHADPLLGPWLQHAQDLAPDGNAILCRDAVDFTRDPASRIQAMLNVSAVLRSGLPNPRYLYLPVDPHRPDVMAFISALGAQHLEELDLVGPPGRVECHLLDCGPGGVLGLERDLIYLELGLAPPGVSRSESPDPEAVRAALRNLRLPHLLARSPLATGDGVEERAASVRRRLEEAATNAFGDTENERLLQQVLHRGYIDPEGSHEQTARELNLSRATYFRRLKLASDRVAQYLSVRPE